MKTDEKMTPKLKFVENEKVLCFHGPLIYEAKALKSQITKDKQIKYYIHYAGWNKNWDEWVPESRVLKYNEANVQRQKEVYKQHSSTAGRKKGGHKGRKSDVSSVIGSKDGGLSSGGSESRASTPTKDVANSSASVTSSTVRSNRKAQAKDIDKRDKESDPTGNKDEEPAAKKKRMPSATSCSDKASSNGTTDTTSAGAEKPITNVEGEESFLSRVEVKIKIPDELKQCLADDWDAITRQHKLLDIPAKTSVQDVVDQYIAYKKSSKTTNPTKEVAMQDVLSGIIEYFNVMLGSQLLYKFERPQYAEILTKHASQPPAKLYGAFHLLRLFVKLGNMLAFSALDEKSMQVLLSHLTDFLKYLAKNSATLYNMSSFINASPEYHRHTQ